MTEILGFLVATTLLAGYFLYYKSVKNGVRPNTTLWTLWTFGSLLDLASYAALSGDWLKNILPITCAVACIILYIKFLLNGKFQRLTRENVVIIVADVFAIALWIITESALVANIAMQVSTILSFIPVYKEIYDEDENETMLPWGIWTVTYLLDIVLVVSRWDKWGDLIYPATNFVLHFLVLLLVYLHFYSSRTARPHKNSRYDIEKHLYVAKSKIAGRGLFTSKKIKKGEVAFILKGEHFPFSPKNKEEALQHPNIFGFDKGLWIDPAYPYDHINHRCSPNLSVASDALSFVALRDISAGEELTFDYSVSEYSDWEMSCSCGTDKCRRTIRSIEKLPPEYFSTYYPLVPHYFEKVYFEKYVRDNP